LRRDARATRRGRPALAPAQSRKATRRRSDGCVYHAKASGFPLGAGGKRWQVPRLQAVWAAHTDRRLVEPFCGGLAVALGLLPDRALLNDAYRLQLSLVGSSDESFERDHIDLVRINQERLQSASGEEVS